MFSLSTPNTQIDGASISTDAEKTARALGLTILIIGIIMALYSIGKGFSDYSDAKEAIRELKRYGDYGGYANEVSSKAFSELLMPQIISALLYLIIAFFAYAGLKVFSNISLTMKAQTFGDISQTPHQPTNHNAVSAPQAVTAPNQHPSSHNVASAPQASQSIPIAPIYICPHCGFEVNKTMTQCPECQTPLRFQ